AGPGARRRGFRDEAVRLPRRHRGGPPPRDAAALPPRLGGRLPRPVKLPDRAPPLPQPGHEQQHILLGPGGRSPARRGRATARPITAVLLLLPPRGGDHPPPGV